MSDSHKVNIEIKTLGDPSGAQAVEKAVKQVDRAAAELWEQVREQEVAMLTESLGLTSEEANAARAVLDQVREGVEELAQGVPENLEAFARELEAKTAPAMAELEKKVLARREVEYQAHRKKMAAWKEKEVAEDRQREEQAMRERLARNAKQVEMQRALADAEQMRREQLIASSVPAYDPNRELAQLRDKAAATAAMGRAAVAARPGLAGFNQVLTQAAYMADDLQYGFRGVANNLQMLMLAIPGVGGALAALAVPVIGQFLSRLGEADNAKLEKLRAEVELTKEAISGMGERLREVADKDLAVFEERVKKSMAAYREAMAEGAREKAALDAQAQADLEVRLAELEAQKERTKAELGGQGDEAAIEANFKQQEALIRRAAEMESLAREAEMQRANVQRAQRGGQTARDERTAAERRLGGRREDEAGVRARLANAGVVSDQERAIQEMQRLQWEAGPEGRAARAKNAPRGSTQAEFEIAEEKKSKELAEQMKAIRERVAQAKRDVADGRQTFDQASKDEGLTGPQRALLEQGLAELDAIKKQAEADAKIIAEARAAEVQAAADRKAAEAALKVTETKAKAAGIRNETQRVTAEQPKPLIKPPAPEEAPAEAAPQDPQAAQAVEVGAAVRGMADLGGRMGASSPMRDMLGALRTALEDGQGDTAQELAVVQQLLAATGQGQQQNGQAMQQALQQMQALQASGSELSQRLASAFATMAQVNKALESRVAAIEAEMQQGRWRQ